TTANYCAVEPRICTPLRRWTYSLAMLISGFALAPIPPLLLYAIFPIFYDFIGGDQFADAALGPALPLLIGKMLLLSFVLYFIAVALGLLYIVTVPRLLNMLLQQDRTYVLYGLHYYIHQMIVRTSNSQF